jgi:beta-xylosidase
MIDKETLCRKIIELYPEIGACGIDVDVNHDDEKNVWIVNLKKSGHELMHHLEHLDADQCLDGKQCVSLSLEIAQLKKNIMGDQF